MNTGRIHYNNNGEIEVLGLDPVPSIEELFPPRLGRHRRPPENELTHNLLRTSWPYQTENRGQASPSERPARSERTKDVE